MVDFKLDEVQEMLRELAHQFAEDEIRPYAEKWDDESLYPIETIKAAHETGLLNLHIPEAYGGAGLGTFEEVIVNEELAWGDPGFSTAAYATGLACAPIITGATDFQKENIFPWLPKKGRWPLTPLLNQEPAQMLHLFQQLPKKRMMNMLNGSKMWITGAGYADWFFVLAKTDHNAGYRGMSGFIVESDWEGLSLGKKETNMGRDVQILDQLLFDNVRIPEENLVGGSESGGWMSAMSAFDMSRSNIAAHATGLSRAAYQHALNYSHERHSFGKPLHKHQAIQFMLADMKTKVEASRLLTWKSAIEFDNGVTNTESAAHAKRFAADSCMEVTTDAVQVFEDMDIQKNILLQD